MTTESDVLMRRADEGLREAMRDFRDAMIWFYEAESIADQTRAFYRAWAMASKLEAASNEFKFKVDEKHTQPFYDWRKKFFDDIGEAFRD